MTAELASIETVEEMIILGDLTDRELLNHIVKEIADLRKSHEAILVVVRDIKDQVEPTINALKESPIMRMMGVKS
jgi:Icc-related predicted phosphoesterase